MIAAVIVAVTGTIAGLAASVHWDLPSGPTIVAALVAEAAIVWLYAKVRG